LVGVTPVLLVVAGLLAVLAVTCIVGGAWGGQVLRPTATPPRPVILGLPVLFGVVVDGAGSGAAVGGRTGRVRRASSATFRRVI